MKRHYPLSAIASLCAALVLTGCERQPEATSNIERTMQFVAAYNEHDVAAMIEMVTEDVRWMSVADDTISTEAAGRSALKAGMENYFEQRDPSPSRMRSLASSGDYVLGVEQVSRRPGDDRPNQCSVVVYEFRGSLIKDVWYYPAHAC